MPIPTRRPRGPTLPAHRLPDLPGRVAIPEQQRGTFSPLEHFNTAPADTVRGVLLSCLSSVSWADRIVAHRPYPDLGALLAAADEAAYDLGPADLAEALAAESLPALPADTYAAAHTALSAAHAAYEARFGHVFVIYLGDTPVGEILDRVLEGIRSRLANDPEEERIVAADQLRRLAKKRLLDAAWGARGRDGAAPGG
ncbi:2-oxo-4-hydroxy-4-carboxy-5-ureidoimidazoline decarboxylase [Streptomyces sp. DH24]|uniref:2-oxo-4-hydroxy-4-carboxy-5-ureidoimidazoline decarboxylase n=1 Tax=Streptomyces sp. DH24 TaxID=3040123 RepID=UPI00244259FB|nr:2-oxo-4-hydroxy-4-carboxy-5-ureidoimidazoline decarboxylase [Streptomyces sp. DH24]MDG9720767.1 2-oxo-4-hydroxy-4-carboxy-5-ureidoimidazoline decarboxylase [Streptomyces sp. DH24]